MAGLLSGRYGGKWVFGLGNLITAIGTLLTPLVANTSKELFILVRVVEGLAEVTLVQIIQTVHLITYLLDKII